MYNVTVDFGRSAKGKYPGVGVGVGVGDGALAIYMTGYAPARVQKVSEGLIFLRHTASLTFFFKKGGVFPFSSHLRGTT